MAARLRIAVTFLGRRGLVPLFLFLLVAFVPVARGQDGEGGRTIREVLDGPPVDGTQGATDETVHLRGIVTLPVGSIPRSPESFFIQDDTGGIRVTGATFADTLKVGRPLAVSGTVVRDDGGVRIELKDVAFDAASPVHVEAATVGEREVALGAYVGKLVHVSGLLVGKGNDTVSTYVVLGRTGGQVLVRPPAYVKRPELALQPFKIGQPVAAEGVLVHSGTNPRATFQVLLRDPRDLSSVFLPRHLWPWAVAAALFALFVIVAFQMDLLRRAANRRTRRQRALFDQSETPMLELDAELKIHRANLSAGRMLGQLPRVMRAQTLTRFVDAGRDFDHAGVAHHLQENGRARFDATVELRDGGRRSIEVMLNVYEHGGKQHVLAVLLDVTEQQRNVDRYESFIQQLIDASPVEVAILSPDGRYHYVNPVTVQDERARITLIGQTDFDYCKKFGLHMEIALRRRSYRKQAIETKELVTFEEAIVDASGDEKRYLRRYHPHLDAEGDVSMVIAYGTEMSEVEKLQKELETAREEADKMLRLKEAFLQNVSHELRTPLTGMVGFAQILKEEVPEALQEFADNIVQNGNRLMETLNATLDLAGLEAEKVQMNPQLVNLVKEVELVVKTLEDTASDKELFLKVSAERPEILTKLDPTSLKRVLNNLISNSIKFTETGGVIVEVSGNEERVYVRVMDSGVGIDRSFVPQIFEAFNQEDASADRPFEGVGLGLTVTKQLVAMMDGDIKVLSDKGEGSMFLVSFPAALRAPSKDAPSRPKVLIADRNAEMPKMAKYMLESYFQVFRAENLEATLDSMRETVFDAVLVDVDIDADYTPFDLLTELRSLGGYAHVPIVAVDAKALPGNHAQLRRDGYDNYLTKPFDKLSLLNVLADQVAQRSAAA